MSYTLAEESQNTLSAAMSLAQSRAPELLSLNKTIFKKSKPSLFA